MALLLLLPVPLLLLLLMGGQPGLAVSYPGAPTLLLLLVSCCMATPLQHHSHHWGGGGGIGREREQEVGVLSRREGSQLIKVRGNISLGRHC